MARANAGEGRYRHDAQVQTMAAATAEERRRLARVPRSPARAGQGRGRAAPRGEVEKGPREGHVALTAEGKPWGQYGLDNAFERVRDRAGLAGWSVYALRHYAITTWLCKGIPVHVVQKMAGHRDLSTT